MNKNCLIFTDLDDTLFSTERKQSEYDLNYCTVASVKNNGEPSGFVNPIQNFLFEQLKNMGDIIPITARVTEQLERVVLLDNFKHAAWYQGAIVKINNEIDLDWKNKSLHFLSKAQKDFNTMKEIMSKNKALKGLKFSNTPYKDLNDLAYQFHAQKITKNNALIDIDTMILYLKSELDMSNYYIHKQYDYFSVIPKEINKKNAVNYIKSKLNPFITFGCGDSDVDVSFMKECDYAIFPKKSIAFNTMTENLN